MSNRCLPGKVTENVDFYLENGNVVFTALFHLKRGECCGTGCRHCPFDPKHLKGNKKINEENKLKKEI
jgi:hypothetical protein